MLHSFRWSGVKIPIQNSTVSFVNYIQLAKVSKSVRTLQYNT